MTAVGTMTPVEHAHFYYEHVWSQLDVDLIPVLCADPILRHDPTVTEVHDHARQRERILRHKDSGLVINILSSHGDAEFATLVWEITSPTYNMAGIEVMRIAGGKILEVWNCLREGILWQS